MQGGRHANRELQWQRRICNVSSPESVDRKLAPTHHLISSTSSRMEAIKKKMQAMKVEKDNACDRVDVCEEQCKAARVRTILYLALQFPYSHA